MSILHLVPHFGIGGDMTVVKSMVRVQETTEQVWINALPSEAVFGSVQAENPFPLNKGLSGLLRALRNLSLVPAATEIFHAHSPICVLFALLARRVRCPNAAVVFTFHWPVPDQGLRRKAKGWLFRQADIVHLFSEKTCEAAAERYGISKSRMKVLPVGVASERFMAVATPSAKSAMRRRWNLPVEAKILGYLGRLATEKNCEFLIRFMHAHHTSFPDLMLVIAGAGDLSDELHRYAEQGPARDRIRFLGYTREPESVYPTFDLLILPSDFEAFPQVVIEASYCSVPTLRSDVEGSADQIRDGETGFLYPQTGGYEAMEDTILLILKNDWNRLPAMGAAAQTHCMELCDFANFTRGLAEIYVASKR